MIKGYQFQHYRLNQRVMLQSNMRNIQSIYQVELNKMTELIIFTRYVIANFGIRNVTAHSYRIFSESRIAGVDNV